MNSTTEERKMELFEKIYNLEIELENPSTSTSDYEDAKFELMVAKDEYVELCRKDCEADGEHLRMTTFDGACFNCGAAY